ncbi:GNAT family N-acetyltransferase [Oceanobacillus chungangensis]|uniref:Spermidine acetyltransferase n=1 Tax=Oceanobacillus chungangensis TaxID=1229152 RepID=A0A3D8PUM4_9BACI|nr:GNAT family N-acetyltransferase [Oceanobacillus chungangensis]RDW19816.1 spermidine acetyltransferase [Oceanobacillus chungangensis]
MPNNIEIKAVTNDNFFECINLEVAESQKSFVASNVFTIAQSYVDKTLVPYAIYDKNTVVGLAALEYNSVDKHWITRFMIGEKFQGKGYGRQAMQEIIELQAKHDDCDRIRLSVVPENNGAITFYEKSGFAMTDEVIDGELVMELLLDKKIFA